MNLDLVNHEHEPRKINLPHRDSKCKALLSSFRFEEANRVEKLGQGDWGGVLLVAELEFELRGGGGQNLYKIYAFYAHHVSI